MNHVKVLEVILGEVSDRVDEGSVGSHGPKSVMNVQSDQAVLEDSDVEA